MFTRLINYIKWVYENSAIRMPGQSQLLQRTAVDIIEEIKDEFPAIKQITTKSQSKEPILATSKTVLAKVLKSPKGTVVINGLIGLTKITDSTARYLRPQLTNKFLELNNISKCLLKIENSRRQSFYNIRNRKGFLLQMAAFPAKTVFTSLIYACYAVLIYVTLYINVMVGLMKNLVEEEKSSTLRKSNESGSSQRLPSSSATVRYYGCLPQQQACSSNLRKLCSTSNIQVIHSVFDERTEKTEMGADCPSKAQ
ncbi:spermatogenesis-associated protein 9 [Rhinatrema bivittatum]|uniref:spermatogenesis-associated protein 9 n=1 Tax=Rhinatrema bivittatum TaxID=194408 RepID=UPI0011267923|nr:spermatogenesis-associated protein 9 [Rhinatrema bivittatum]